MPKTYCRGRIFSQVSYLHADQTQWQSDLELSGCLAKMRAYFLSIILVLVSQVFIAPVCMAGGIPKRDLIEFPLPNIPADSNKVNTLNDSFKVYLQNDPDRAYFYAKKALEIAKEVGYEKGVAKMTNNMGVFLSMTGEYKESLEYLTENCRLRKAMGDMASYADGKINVGNLYYKQGSFNQALVSYQGALDIYIKEQDTSGVLGVLNNVGSVRKEQGKTVEAMESYLQVMKMRVAMGDSEQVAITSINLGYIYQIRKMFKESEASFVRAMDIFEDLNDAYGQVNVLSAHAGLKSDQGFHKEAIEMLEEARGMAENVKDQYGLAEALLGLAYEYNLKEETQTAFTLSSQALEICKDIGRKQGEAMALVEMGEAQQLMGNFRQSNEFLLEALEISKNNEFRDQGRAALELISGNYAKLGLFEKAYGYHREFYTLYDSIYSEESQQRIADMHARYNDAAKEMALDELRLKQAEQELRLSRSELRTTILIGSLILVIILILILWWRFQQKKRLNQISREQKSQLLEQNKAMRQINANLEKVVETRTRAVLAVKEELDVFLYQSAHALRRPLLRIEGIVSLIERELEGSDNKNMVDNLRVTIGDMDSLLHKLIMVNEVLRREPELVEIDPAALLQEASSTPELKDVEVEINLEPGLALVSDERLFSLVAQNLLENSGKYANRGEQHHPWVKVHLGVTEDESEVQLTVRDNGTGIPEGTHSVIFEMFTRANHLVRGNGLGLYVVQKSVEALYGRIELEETAGEGATFHIFLPYHRV